MGRWQASVSKFFLFAVGRALGDGGYYKRYRARNVMTRNRITNGDGCDTFSSNLLIDKQNLLAKTGGQGQREFLPPSYEQRRHSVVNIRTNSMISPIFGRHA